MHRLVDRRNLEESVTAPRLFTEGGLIVHAEREWPPAEIQYLKQIGYSIAGGQQCYVAAVEIDATQKDRPIVGVADDPPGNGPGVRSSRPTVVHA